jgi:serine O-acetyltransferase
LSRSKRVLQQDLNRNLEWKNKNYSELVGLIFLLAFNKAFRNIFYYRLSFSGFFLNIICPQSSTFRIDTERIGEGFSIVHGFATTVGAKSIGRNFTVFQQVTIGAAAKLGSPTILDNVTVYAGAIIIGNVTIGNNVVIGANATVYVNVPDNSTVLPGTSKIMKWRKEV